MARPPSFKIPAMAELLRQLRYAPPETKKRQMDAAEALVGEIDPGREYPLDYIAFRITSFRSDASDASEVSPGDLLISDLASFIERLSESLALRAADYRPRVALSTDEIAGRLKVSATTLHRYRKQGLIAHNLIDGAGRRRIVFFEDSLDRFVKRRPGQVESAARFSRVDEETAERMIRRAQRYRRSLGLSLNEAAQRLARRFGRSHEAVRQLLMRHDARRPGDAIFPDGGPLSERDRRVLFRAHRFGAPIPLLASRFERSRSSIYRAVNVERAARLNGLALAPIVLPTFQIEGADEVLLSPQDVRAGFDPAGSLGGDAIEWVERAAAIEPPRAATETRWIAAMNYLVFSAAARRELIDMNQPSAHELDIIETRLRWASRLKARILVQFQRSLLRTIEIHVGRRLLTRPADEIQRLHRAALNVARRAVAAFDPARGQRFETYLLFLLRRALATAPFQIDSHKAMALARHSPGAIMLDDPVRSLDPWQAWLEPRSSFMGRISSLSPTSSEVVVLRYGWSGEAPMTTVQVAERLGLTPERIAAVETRAMRELRRRDQSH